MSLQSENVRFVQSRNVRFHGWPRGLWRIEWIAAQSPQAKGRIERLFATLQDRLVKEMRLAGIASIEAANRARDDHRCS